MALHIVSKSPYSSSALDDCLAASAAGDAIILIEDGVYAAQLGDNRQGQFAGKKVYCLQADAEARGISAFAAITAIDENRWVDLCTEYNPIVSWFK